MPEKCQFSGIYARSFARIGSRVEKIEIMKTQIMFAHFALPAHVGALWGFMGLVLLIGFVTLVAVGDSKDKEK